MVALANNLKQANLRLWVVGMNVIDVFPPSLGSEGVYFLRLGSNPSYLTVQFKGASETPEVQNIKIGLHFDTDPLIVRYHIMDSQDKLRSRHASVQECLNGLAPTLKIREFKPVGSPSALVHPTYQYPSISNRSICGGDDTMDEDKESEGGEKISEEQNDIEGPNEQEVGDDDDTENEGGRGGTDDGEDEEQESFLSGIEINSNGMDFDRSEYGSDHSLDIYFQM